ncbi:hypothetical protein [Duganella sp. BJB475]|uniref:hypothetical protein n=1 Tax=Duganella sp. BJB475 TaxID=2233914 RepID=UPI000E354E95|nr:hypothetical protein [Duganella sp. BJB475]RFP19160.1 hypothetical protein D0T23_05100 [Duganella sp. BJB475]
MNSAQLAFDFTPPAPIIAHFDFAAHDRAHWRVGMVTSLPCFCKIEGGDHRYSQMLPGVLEAIDDGLASVRIYAAPEYGSWMEGYPLHLALAVDVPLRNLGRYALNTDLQRIVTAGMLADGDPALGAEVRARMAGMHEREIARVA